jgi:hypothetical protein
MNFRKFIAASFTAALGLNATIAINAQATAISYANAVVPFDGGSLDYTGNYQIVDDTDVAKTNAEYNYIAGGNTFFATDPQTSNDLASASLVSTAGPGDISASGVTYDDSLSESNSGGSAGAPGDGIAQEYYDAFGTTKVSAWLLLQTPGELTVNVNYSLFVQGDRDRSNETWSAETSVGLYLYDDVNDVFPTLVDFVVLQRHEYDAPDFDALQFSETGTLSLFFDSTYLFDASGGDPVTVLIALETASGSTADARDAAVPEPSSLCLLGLASLIAARAKHRDKPFSRQAFGVQV